MPFNYNQKLDYMPISSGTLEKAATNAFSVAGREMQGLSEHLDNRKFEKDIQGASSLEQLLMMNPTTKKSQDMLNSKMQVVGARDSQDNRDRLFAIGRDKFALEQQKQSDMVMQRDVDNAYKDIELQLKQSRAEEQSKTNALTNSLTKQQIANMPLQRRKLNSDLVTSELTQQEAERVFELRHNAQKSLDNNGAFNPDAFTLNTNSDGTIQQEGISPTGFTELGLAERIDAERAVSPTGKSGTYAAWKEQNAKASPSRRDMLQQLNVATTEYNNAVANGDEKEIRQKKIILERLSKTGGERQEAGNIGEAVNAVSFGKSISRDGMSSVKNWKPEDWNKAVSTEEAYSTTAKGKLQAKLVPDYSKKANSINDVIMSGNTLDKLIASGKYETGVLDSSVSGLGKYLTKDARGTLGYDEEKFKAYVQGGTEIGMAVADYVRSVSGLAVTNAEFDRLQGIIAGSDFQDETARLTAIKSFTNAIVKKYDAESKSMSSSGFGATAAQGWTSATRNYNAELPSPKNFGF